MSVLPRAAQGWAGTATPARARLRSTIAALALATGSLAAGAGLAAVGDRLGPAWVIGVPALLMTVAAAYALPLLPAALVLASMPVGLVGIPGTPLQLVEVVVLLAVVLVAARRSVEGLSPLPVPRVMAWALLLLGVVLVASLDAVDPAAALKQDLQLAAGVLLALGVVGAVRTARDVRILIAVALGMGALVGALVLGDIDTLRSSFDGAVIEGRAQGVFTQPNELGSFAAMMLLIALGVLCARASRALRALAILAAVASAGALTLSFSRGAWIGAAVGLVVLLVLLPAARPRMLAAALVALTVVSILAAVRPEEPRLELARGRIGSIGEPSANPYDPRPALWREGWRQATEAPVIGQGPGGFRAAAAGADSVARVDVPHAHNALLTVAAEAGIPAAALLVALTLAAGLTLRATVRRLAEARQATEAALIAGLAAALATVVTHGVVDYTLRNGVLFLLAWFLLGLALAAARVLPGGVADAQGRESTSAGGRRWARRRS